MRYQALACDYDGTLAHDGELAATTAAALVRLRESGRRLLMVTGRELEELKQVCPVLDLFEIVVAENGALLYRPADNEIRLLCPPPSPLLVERLRAARVEPFSVGHAIVATREPYDTVVQKVIAELGLSVQVIFNKGAVMILPEGVNKATGLEAALSEMQLAPAAVVGVGDAENDHAFLEQCGLGVAVANALPMLKSRADIVTQGARGDGVIELINRMLENDLADVRPRALKPRSGAQAAESHPGR